jgi:hypothetical protein
MFKKFRYTIITASAQEDHRKATRYLNQERRSAVQDSTLKRSDSRTVVLISMIATFFVLKQMLTLQNIKEEENILRSSEIN